MILFTKLAVIMITLHIQHLILILLYLIVHTWGLKHSQSVYTGSWHASQLTQPELNGVQPTIQLDQGRSLMWPVLIPPIMAIISPQGLSLFVNAQSGHANNSKNVSSTLHHKRTAFSQCAGLVNGASQLGSDHTNLPPPHKSHHDMTPQCISHMCGARTNAPTCHPAAQTNTVVTPCGVLACHHIIKEPSRHGLCQFTTIVMFSMRTIQSRP